MADLTPKLRGLRSPFWLPHRSPPPRSACPCAVTVARRLAPSPARRTSPPRHPCRGRQSPHAPRHSPPRRLPPPRSACPARRTSPPRYSCRGRQSPHTPRRSPPRRLPRPTYLAPSPLAEAASLRRPHATHPRAAPSPARRTSPPRHPCRGRPFPHAPRRHRARQCQEALPAPLATPILRLFLVLRSEDRARDPDGGENIAKTKIKKRVIFLRPLTTAFGRKINALF